MSAEFLEESVRGGVVGSRLPGDEKLAGHRLLARRRVPNFAGDQLQQMDLVER